MNRAFVWSCVLSCTLFGCGTPVQSRSTAPATRTVTDDFARQIRLPEHPRRIVSLNAGSTEIVCALGARDLLVGVDHDSNFPPEAQKLPQVGVSGNPSVELIAALAPDVVLASSIQTRAFVDSLTRHGIPVIALNATSLEGVLHDIQLVGQVVQQTPETNSLCASLRLRIQSAKQSVRGVKRPKVFVELTSDLYTVGPGTFLNELVEAAGGENLAKNSRQAWPQFSQEALIMQDPEVILMTDHPAGVTAEQVRRRPGWQNIRAVKNGRVYVLNADITVRPGPRVIDGLEQLVRVLHPEVASRR